MRAQISSLKNSLSLSSFGKRWHDFGAGRILVLLALLLIILVGGWLRIRYVQQVALHVDEFVTLWAAQRILETGLPFMPSGMFYGRGLLTSYLAAGAMAVGGLNDSVGRIPGVLFGIFGIIAIFAVGRNAWNVRVGLLAAVGLTLLPEAIDAAGRVRFYAQFMLWTLLTLWAAYQLTRRPGGGWRIPLLVVISFTLALFTQEEMILLYPAIVLGLLLWHGIGVFRKLPVVFVLVGCAGAIAARYLLERVGAVDSFDAVQSNKAYLGLFLFWQKAWDSFAWMFIEAQRFGWTLFAIIAVMLMLIALRRSGWRPAELAPEHQATLYFGLFLAWVWLLMATVVGESWHAQRYMLFVLPNWLLLGAAGMTAVIDRLFAAPNWRWAATLAATLAIVWLMQPMAASALKPNSVDYTGALTYVAEHRTAGDRVATPQPPACAWVMGAPCAYYARGLDYEPYVVRQNGQLVDRWTGALLLSSAAELKGALSEGHKIWLVVDRDRLANRYDRGSLQVILEQFDVVQVVGDTLVLAAKGLRPTPVYTHAQVAEPALSLGPLRLVGWQTTALTEGTPFRAVLDWSQDGTLKQEINTSLQLVAANGERISQADGPPADGQIRMRDVSSRPIPDFKLLHLPAELPDGWYRLEVIAYTGDEHTLLGDPAPFQWLHVGQRAAPAAEPTRVVWVDGLELTGTSTFPAQLLPGEALSLALDWNSTERLFTDYTAFVQLIGPEETLVAQHDKAPLDGFYPTSHWTPGTLVTDDYALQLPEMLPPGAYRLIAGWYDPATGERLRTTDGRDAVELKAWTVPP